MDNKIIEKLLPAAMLGSAEGAADSFEKMSVNIDRVLRSDFADGTERLSERSAHNMPHDMPYIIKVEAENGELREDSVTLTDAPVALSKRWEEPYITVPRVVGA